MKKKYQLSIIFGLIIFFLLIFPQILLFSTALLSIDVTNEGRTAMLVVSGILGLISIPVIGIMMDW